MAGEAHDLVERIQILIIREIRSVYQVYNVGGNTSVNDYLLIGGEFLENVRVVGRGRKWNWKSGWDLLEDLEH